MSYNFTPKTQHAIQRKIYIGLLVTGAEVRSYALGGSRDQINPRDLRLLIFLDVSPFPLKQAEPAT